MRKKISGIIISCILLCLQPAFTTIVTTEPTRTLPPTTITIITPEEGNLYIWGTSIAKLPLNLTVIIGPITVVAGVTGVNGFIVDFSIDGIQKFHDDSPPFEYAWTTFSFGSYLLEAELYGYDLQDSIKVVKIL